MQENLVVVYESRKLKTQEKNYVLYALELVVVIYALKIWRHCLLGMKITLITYYITLKYLFGQRDLNARQTRWLDFPSEFQFNIRHIKGKENKIVDALNGHGHDLMGVSVSAICRNLIEKI